MFQFSVLSSDYFIVPKIVKIIKIMPKSNND